MAFEPGSRIEPGESSTVPSGEVGNTDTANGESKNTNEGGKTGGGATGFDASTDSNNGNDGFVWSK